MHRLLSRVMILTLVCVMPLAILGAQDADEVSLRILWFDDNNESVVLREILNDFEAEYPNISVEIDLATASEVNDKLRNEIDSGEQPDIARTNLPGLFVENLLDIRPYVEDPTYWDDNFNSGFLASLRSDPTSDSLHGYPTDLTISAPFINRSLWEEAGVPIPSDTIDAPTWDDWIRGALMVQAALATADDEVYAMAMDRSGHRFWGPSLSYCATYVDANDPSSDVNIDTQGFRDALMMFKQLHDDGIMPMNVWNGDSDTTVPAAEFFIDQQLAFYFSGNWQLNRFYDEIGNDFRWQMVPNPVGPCGQTGMIGGNSMVAIAGTEHPEEVGLLMDYLASYEPLERFYRENLLLPGHLSMNQNGIEYDALANELKAFQIEISRAMPEAFALQFRTDSAVIHGAVRKSVVDMLQFDLSIDDTVACAEHYLTSTDPCQLN